jgi:ubiquinone/menaquinone biosynthesis C-methylase UbiE
MTTLAQASPRDLARGHKGPPMEGAVARWYAKNTKGEMRSYRETARAIAARLRAGASVLEVAPGPGYMAIELAKLGLRVSGLDISHSFVAIATANARDAGVSIDFRQGNASALPHPDASFDAVICRAAFKNFADPVGAIDEMHRVLRPGGQASIFDLRKESSAPDVRTHVDAMGLSSFNSLLTRLTFRFFLLKHAYTTSDMEELAARSRFGSCTVLASGIEFEARFRKVGERAGMDA